MKSLLQQLTDVCAAAFEAEGLSAEFGDVRVSDRPDLAQFQCNGALAAAKQAGENPREIAAAVLEHVMESPLIASAEIAGPGFLNIMVAPEALTAAVCEASEDDRFGIEPVENPLKVTIDYGGLNVAKPMHVGHIRSLAIGDSLKRLMRFMGHTVDGDVHLGDWGTHIGMVITEIQRRQPDLPYFDEAHEGEYPAESPVTIDDLSVIYPAASGRCKDNPADLEEAKEVTARLQAGEPGLRALWRHIMDVSLATLKEEVGFLGVHFELWNGEADYHDRIPAMIERLQNGGFVEESEGAVIVPFTFKEGEREIPPLILVKSDGGYLYGTTDLATIEQRVDELHQELLLYVIDARQSLHVEQVFKAAQLSGIAGDTDMYHVKFGTVNGKDGKPFKTRKGDAMRLRGLIQEVIDESHKRMDETGVGADYPEDERQRIGEMVAVAALKFADLINTRTADYIFDLEKFTQFEGKTGPYLLYSAVRMKSILRKVEEASIQAGPIQAPGEAETGLMLKMAEMPEVVAQMYQDYMPHVLAGYLFELAQAFNTFYQECNIMKEEDAARQAGWVQLTQHCLKQMEFALDLLGIEVPERM